MRRSIRGYSLLSSLLLALGLILVGVVLVALTNKAVLWSSSDRFCGQACHSMNWASAAYQQGPHYINRTGIRASCGECHIPYDSSHATAIQYVKLLLFKANWGAKDFWYESRHTIATKEEWEKRRPILRAEFESYLRSHNYVTCRGCHALESFGGQRSEMKRLIHNEAIQSDDVDCLRCHRNIGHVYAETGTQREGWYTLEQASSGEKLYASSCVSCHGAQLEGGVGPALTGSSWHQLYGGAKLLTVWGEIKGPMAQFAGKKFTTQESLDLLAFLLQRNGLPPGARPLTDTRELSSVLPQK